MLLGDGYPPGGGMTQLLSMRSELVAKTAEQKEKRCCFMDVEVGDQGFFR